MFKVSVGVIVIGIVIGVVAVVVIVVVVVGVVVLIVVVIVVVDEALSTGVTPRCWCGVRREASRSLCASQ
jgi:hypothetical protein